MHTKNGRIELPRHEREALQAEQAERLAAAHARGQFKAVVGEHAGRIAAAIVGADKDNLTGTPRLDDSRLDMIATTAVALARKVAIETHKVAFPTREELGLPVEDELATD